MCYKGAFCAQVRHEAAEAIGAIGAPQVSALTARA